MVVSASDTTDAPAATATATAAVIPESEAMVEGGGGAGAAAAAGGGAAAPIHDRDLLCPICMGMIKDAFLTLCGHSFCYMCIVTHLNNKNDCPCCGHYLTSNQLYPNFLLNKGCEMSVKKLDSLLYLLLEKKRKIEQEEAETNMQILLDFLHCLRKQKLEKLNKASKLWDDEFQNVFQMGFIPNIPVGSSSRELLGSVELE